MSVQEIHRASGGAGDAVRHPVRAAWAAVLLTVVAVLLALIAPTQAHAAGRVDVSPAPAADGPTTVVLSGSGFQYQPNAPGGVYVFFGAVNDPATNSWTPSQGGRSGETFAYAGTEGSRLLVAFAGGSSAGDANGVIDANGTWSAQLTIPGARFSASFGNPHEGAQGAGQEIDCLQVQCGIITIGAHGLVNANNESFTPVSFATADGQLQSGAGAATSFADPSGAQATDAATKIEVPGAATEGADATADAADTAETQAAAAAETEAAAAAAAALEAAAAEEAPSGLTIAVLAILGFAVLALITAVVIVLVKRGRRGRQTAAAPAAVTGAATATQATASEPTANETTVNETTVTGGAVAHERAGAER